MARGRIAQVPRKAAIDRVQRAVLLNRQTERDVLIAVAKAARELMSHEMDEPVRNHNYWEFRLSVLRRKLAERIEDAKTQGLLDG